MGKGGVVNIEEFRKKKREAGLKQVRKSAEVYKLPVVERPRGIKQIWICICGEENDGDACWNCNKPKR